MSAIRIRERCGKCAKFKVPRGQMDKVLSSKRKDVCSCVAAADPILDEIMDAEEAKAHANLESEYTHAPPKVSFEPKTAVKWPKGFLHWGMPIAILVFVLSSIGFYFAWSADHSVAIGDAGIRRVNNIGLIADQQTSMIGNATLMALSLFYMVTCSAVAVVRDTIRAGFGRRLYD